MTQIPTIRQQQNIKKFAYAWNEGETGSGKKVKATAQRYLNLYGYWIYQNSHEQYSLIVGCIEWHNHYEI